MAGGSNNNQQKAIKGSGRNGGSSGSGDSNNGNKNSNSIRNSDGDSDDANPNALHTPLEAMFAPLSALAEYSTYLF
jgi:hypothetical protein